MESYAIMMLINPLFSRVTGESLNSCYKSPGQAIICFDIDTERFRTMELPSSTRMEDTSMDIWIIKDYGVVESWTKLYSIRPPYRYAFGPKRMPYYCKRGIMDYFHAIIILSSFSLSRFVGMIATLNLQFSKRLLFQSCDNIILASSSMKNVL
ncbi:hypothetical protein LIER_31389 [Lithospermum erythrorhizon]|uniref:F-box associated domain-containing protein n=1 Tax=Lithospermum erythrorhizon TaxID=34254 RepID=A0AAV3RQT1_LITER